MATVGIVGGVGPMASARFYARLIALTSADSDQDHLSAVLIADPVILAIKELPIIASLVQLGIPVLDATDVFAAATLTALSRLDDGTPISPRAPAPGGLTRR
jgi:aspartate/glutamate racemase